MIGQQFLDLRLVQFEFRGQPAQMLQASLSQFIKARLPG